METPKFGEVPQMLRSVSVVLKWQDGTKVGVESGKTKPNFEKLVVARVYGKTPEQLRDLLLAALKNIQ